MSFIDSVFIALFCMSVVFVVLGLLWLIIRTFSFIIITFEKRINRSNNRNTNS